MVMETIDKVISNLGAADIDARLEELLVDGILYAFQEQVRGCEGAQAAQQGTAVVAHKLMAGRAIRCKSTTCMLCVGDYASCKSTHAA